MSDKDTLLPPTATDLVKVLDALEERLFSLPVQMITKDPMTADVGLLDHLAWEYSVDAWDSNWTEDIKRQVIAVSAEVHRHKGTPFAIRKAMSAFGVDIELIEWFDSGGSGVPGTFIARAYVTNPLDGATDLIVTDPIVSAMQAILNRVSPVSRGWALQLGVRSEPTVYQGAFALTHLRVIAGAHIDPPPVLDATSSFAVIATTRITSIATAA
ncbi:pyocin R2_PP, tail formation protein GpI [Rhodobacteraceae bacterium KLH11]|nr:pyocin R2_PP, tail formation protein GpI [Rhodobacteraceae bacterium KLH11]